MFSSRFLQSLVLALFATSGAIGADSGFSAPEKLRCEYLVDPAGIDETAPRLGWIDVAADPGARGLVQTAYQVLVASSEEKLAADEGDLWDSGKVASSKSSQIVYAGEQLKSHQACFWKVCVWDGAENPPVWSKPARWSMGLLDQDEWTAEWIGRDDGRPMAEAGAIAGAKWIWFPEDAPGNAPTNAKRWFSQEFDIPAGSGVSAAKVWMTADNTFTLFVNGREVLSGNNFHEVPSADITDAIRPGANVLTVEAANEEAGPAGLIGSLEVMLGNGETVSLVTDAAWMTTDRKPAILDRAPRDTDGWTNAKVVAKQGDAPWGKIEKGATYLPVPHLRKDFELARLPQRAVLYITCLGNVEPRLNGNRVGEDYFVPGWTDYRKRLYYRAYDVTDQLRTGPNTVGAMLADGWFRGNISILGQNFYGTKTRLRAQLHLFEEDGTMRIIPTDTSWTAGFGPILEADMQAGETYDARREMPGWDSPGFAGNGWRAPDTGAEVSPAIEAYPGAPVRRLEAMPEPVVTTPKPGLQVLDFGRNFSGWVRLRVNAPAGTKIVMRFGEMLAADGTVYRENLRSARATDTYICKGGGEEVWEPAFTFHGFQFVEVEGLPGPVRPGMFTAHVVHSDLPRVGGFDTSNEIAKRTTDNMRWSVRSNSFDIPTDCPQRDERMGWMDYHEVARSAQYELDQSALFTKWVTDMMDARLADGGFSQISPAPHRFQWSPGWADSAVLIPWTMYLVQGDTRLADRWFDELASHVEYYRERSPELVGPDVGFGDWLAPDQSTPKDLISTALFARCSDTFSKMATALGRDAEAEKHRYLFERIREAFQKKFVKSDGTIGSNSQGGYAMAIAFDLLDEAQLKRAAGHFVKAIEAKDNHLSTGMVTTHLLLPSLTKIGRSDVAYRLVNQRTFPSWGYFLDRGATSMWERWDSKTEGFHADPMNSYNHANLGTCTEWFYRMVLGIDVLEPGFGRILIKPTPGGKTTRARGHYDSPRGRIVSAWELESGRFQLDVTIPPNATAEVHVPASSASGVTEGGKPAASAEGVKFLREENGCAVFEVGSGSYAFRSE